MKTVLFQPTIYRNYDEDTLNAYTTQTFLRSQGRKLNIVMSIIYWMLVNEIKELKKNHI